MLKEPFEKRQVLAGRGVRYVRVLGYDWSVSGWSVAGGGGGRGGGVACGGSVAMPTDTDTLDRQLHGRDVGGAAVLSLAGHLEQHGRELPKAKFNARRGTNWSRLP